MLGVMIFVLENSNLFQTIYYSVRKVSDFIFKNLVDFNEVCLHKATLNLHMHA